MGKITKQQLSDSLLQYINSIKGSSIQFRKNTVTVEEATNKVAIGISDYNKDSDLLMVYKNTVYLEDTIMYTVSSDNAYINNPNGTWDANSLFNFIVIKITSSLPNSGNSDYQIPDSSITEAKLDQNVRAKLNKISTLEETVRYKSDSIVEADLDQGLKEKLNIGGAKTWANLMGQ